MNHVEKIFQCKYFFDLYWFSLTVYLISYLVVNLDKNATGLNEI